MAFHRAGETPIREVHAAGPCGAFCFMFAFVYHPLGAPLAAGVLYPLTGLLLSPMIAALAMSLSSASVISNVLRLRNARI
ncbi:hypothetical protein DF156_31065 [Burkholderia ubonensis]|nr:hypothetical protein DF155_30845 [Burkholderia ubonensis]RQP29738.1 hypothetical protein DF154_32080 [Burkholderia ubonensis]RQP31894.1 hypothetical protein DF156_31065 [Burkholderia ubonensis]RQP47837.1 hypothetical protein DF144_30770 [Burkholderia ubonensis]RQP50854.1 hypothetical protein DF151_30665 [Burkholderia ubonensis]